MKLHRKHSAWKQIRAWQGPLVFDVRGERAGDKAAAVAVAKWISDTVKRPVSFIELPGDSLTAFHLADYVLPYNLSAQQLPQGEPYEGLDVHTLGLGADALWILNAYLAASAEKREPTLRLKTKFDLEFENAPSPNDAFWGFYDKMNNEEYAYPSKTDEILFCLLTDTGYNERRDMGLGDGLEHARLTVDALRAEGCNINILYDKTHPLFPDALNLTMKEAVERIARAQCVIAGDTGFSHISAAFGTPLVAIYPDWPRTGMADLSSAIKVSQWWELPAWNVPKQFLPNAPFDRLRVVEMHTDHRWSLEHVIQSVEELRYDYNRAVLWDRDSLALSIISNRSQVEGSM